MRVKFKKPYFLKKQVITQNDEGMDVKGFGEAIQIEANIQPATSSVQAQMYGMELKYYCNMLYDGDEVITEGDGICVYVGVDEKPDYIVEPIKSYTGHKGIELKKVTSNASK